MLRLLNPPPRRTADDLNDSELRRHRFRSMGMDVLLTAPHDADARTFREAAKAVERTFRRVDLRFSRFRDDSELSRVNARAGRWQLVSAPFAEVLRRSLDAARATDGLFDPTVLPAMIAAGYDRDYDELLASPPRAATEPVGPPRRWRDVELDGRMLFLPRGAAFDFGGIAKGWAVDRALECAAPLPWALVDAGGDMAVAGRAPGPLAIGVADPHDASLEIARLALDSGALATSSVVGRSWGPGLHHVIDPRTWRPASTRVLQATVWAGSCTEAEILATWALLRGPRALKEAAGILVMPNGDVISSMPGSEVAPAC
jgi:thiamine biosynthesis lipoprotein